MPLAFRVILCVVICASGSRVRGAVFEWEPEAKDSVVPFAENIGIEDATKDRKIGIPSHEISVFSVGQRECDRVLVFSIKRDVNFVIWVNVSKEATIEIMSVFRRVGEIWRFCSLDYLYSTPNHRMFGRSFPNILNVEFGHKSVASDRESRLLYVNPDPSPLVGSHLIELEIKNKSGEQGNDDSQAGENGYNPSALVSPQNFFMD
jgi:hypothetical protein